METAFITEPQLEIRREGEHRILHVRCVPYGILTDKAGPGLERFRAHAFAGAVANAARIRLRDANHSPNRLPVAVGLRLEDDDNALYGDYRVYNTPEGRAALENVEEGVYTGVSVGFFAEDDVIEDGIREIRRAQLHHVSLVEEPAYDDARILAIRSADRYAALKQAPDLSRLEADDGDDTPMTMRVARLLGSVGRPS